MALLNLPEYLPRDVLSYLAQSRNLGPLGLSVRTLRFFANCIPTYTLSERAHRVINILGNVIGQNDKRSFEYYVEKCRERRIQQLRSEMDQVH